MSPPIIPRFRLLASILFTLVLALGKDPPLNWRGGFTRPGT